MIHLLNVWVATSVRRYFVVPEQPRKQIAKIGKMLNLTTSGFVLHLAEGGGGIRKGVRRIHLRARGFQTPNCLTLPLGVKAFNSTKSSPSQLAMGVLPPDIFPLG